MPLDDASLKALFLNARTHSHWLERPVTPDLLRQLYELARMAPTAMNSQPLRVCFVHSPEAKAALRPALAAGNVDKTMSAPVTAIAAYDPAFYRHLNRLAPHMAKPAAGFERDANAADRFARNSATLQAAYLILAARALGLDCGPMGGFDALKVDQAFFADSGYRSLLLINLGYGDPDKLHPRAPRLDFDEACTLR